MSRAAKVPVRSVGADRACVARGECRPKHRASKDTARWCKGKRGVEHQYEWRAYDSLPNHFHGHRTPTPEVEWQMRVCATCGRQEWQTRYIHKACGGLVHRRSVKTDNGHYVRLQHVCEGCGWEEVLK